MWIWSSVIIYYHSIRPGVFEYNNFQDSWDSLVTYLQKKFPNTLFDNYTAPEIVDAYIGSIAVEEGIDAAVAKIDEIAMITNNEKAIKKTVEKKNKNDK